MHWRSVWVTAGFYVSSSKVLHSKWYISFSSAWALSAFCRDTECEIVAVFPQKGGFVFTIYLWWTVLNEALTVSKDTCKHMELTFRFKGYLHLNRYPYSAQEKGGINSTIEQQQELCHGLIFNEGSF